MEQEWILGPGDMLYLPPGSAHYGIALNDSLTYSIGFRAASNQELLIQFLIHLQDRVTAEGMYEDADLALQTHPAEISATMINKVASAINRLTWSKDDIAQFLGSYLTEPKPHIFFDPPARPLSLAKFHQAVEKKGLHLSLKTQLLFAGERLFMNGEEVSVKGAALKLLSRLADERVLSGPMALPPAAGEMLYDWYQAGYVLLGERVVNE